MTTDRPHTSEIVVIQQPSDDTQGHIQSNLNQIRSITIYAGVKIAALDKIKTSVLNILLSNKELLRQEVIHEAWSWDMTLLGHLIRGKDHQTMSNLCRQDHNSLSLDNSNHCLEMIITKVESSSKNGQAEGLVISIGTNKSVILG